ncbi:MAG: hypothetical protein GC149_09930 [Gammaproteobacteria bacterium]|nr:hypothetical protein [Gammaproteobacteria bacterium]
MYGLDLNKQTRNDIIALAASYLIMGVSLYLACKYGRADWFARSGSIMVLLSAMSEYQNVNLQEQINVRATRGAGAIGGGVGPLDQPRQRQILLKVLHFSVVFGTFIWGYGDILIPCKI